MHPVASSCTKLTQSSLVADFCCKRMSSIHHSTSHQCETPIQPLGPLQVSTTDSEVNQAANFAAEQLSQQSNSLSPYKVEEVLSARSKVVSGKAFELKLKLSQGNLPEQIVQVMKAFKIS